MLADIVARLKEGSIPNVIPYANGMKTPPPPYVAVKPETGVIPNTRQIRITAHHNEGQFEVLEHYVLTELDQLLLGGITGTGGGRYTLYANGYTDITAEPGGNTYYMERIYYAPLLAAGNG